MSYKAIVSDWNGTLFYDVTDEGIHKEFAYELLRSCLKSMINCDSRSFSNFRKIFESEIKIKRKYREYKKIRARKDIEIGKKIEAMKIIANDIYKIFNENILIGRSLEFVEAVIEKYAMKNKNKIDKRLAEPIRVFHNLGKETFIISGSYERCIKRILELSDYLNAFNDIIGTKIQEYCGIITKIDESLRKRKGEKFKENFLINRKFKENEIIYIGDSEFDLEIGEILQRGNFIVSFLATNDFKELASSHYRAFVPESEEDLIKYLKAKA